MDEETKWTGADQLLRTARLSLRLHRHVPLVDQREKASQGQELRNLASIRFSLRNSQHVQGVP